MKTYNILTNEGNIIPATSNEFFAALYSKDENDKPLYYWYDDGEYLSGKHIRGDNNLLLPRVSEYLTKVYRIHHNSIRREQMRDIRRKRCRDENGKICEKSCSCLCDRHTERCGITFVPVVTEYDDDGYERELPDEYAESKIYSNCERGELVDRIRFALSRLDALDKDIVVLRYGLNGQEPMPKSTIAKILCKNRRTIDRAEKRALENLRELLADFADYV